jgi:hypothetical protein
MIPQPQYKKHYNSARQRFLQSSIESFFNNEFPKIFGPIIRKKIAEKIVEIVNAQLPAKGYLRPGQCIWNAVSIDTRPDSPKRKLVPVILTLIDPSDIEELAQGIPMTVIARKAIARLCREAFEQGALLSMRDIGLLVWRSNSVTSTIRKSWEAENSTSLPHVGSIQDFGTCLTHKTAIIRKVVYEKKDPRRVASETKHSQRAVDRYLKDFNRVKLCHQHSQDMEFITRTTGLSKYLVNQYVDIINNHEK